LSFFRGDILVVVEQYADGWGVQVIVLTSLLRPKKGCQKYKGEQHAAPY
jgi:hypothetical protein